MCLEPLEIGPDSAQPKAPVFSREQKESFAKLACSFLYENNIPDEVISNLEVEIRFSPKDEAGFSPEAAKILTLGCVDGTPVPGDPCFRKGKVWGPMG